MKLLSVGSGANIVRKVRRYKRPAYITYSVAGLGGDAIPTYSDQ